MKRENWIALLQGTIGFLLTIIMGFIAWQSSTWTENMKSLSDNVGQLNIKMEVVVNEISRSKENFSAIEFKNSEQERALSDHEARIRVLERIK